METLRIDINSTTSTMDFNVWLFSDYNSNDTKNFLFTVVFEDDEDKETKTIGDIARAIFKTLSYAESHYQYDNMMIYTNDMKEKEKYFFFSFDNIFSSEKHFYNKEVDLKNLFYVSDIEALTNDFIELSD